jgi:eukaryotic-like serine/threonine-protein kinase
MLKSLLTRLRGSNSDEVPGFATLGVIRDGEMAKIVKAREESTGRLVALKIQKSAARKALEKNENFYADFSEGQITASFEHPNVVRCYAHGEYGGESYSVLEYLDGRPLLSLMQVEKHLLDGQRIPLILQAAAAVTHVHAKRFIHHDVSPKNLFVTSQNRLKLIDFSMATPLLNRPSPFSRVGTTETMAPEILRREPSDYRVDIYAWGVVAYELLSGHWPFASPEHHQTLSKIINVNPMPLIRRTPNVPEEVGNLVMRCIEKDPARRLSAMNIAVGVLERHKGASL